MTKNDTFLSANVVLFKDEWFLPREQLSKLIDTKLEMVKETILDAIDNKIKTDKMEV